MKSLYKLTILGSCIMLLTVAVLTGCSPQAADDSNGREQWIVGTSADYPPFESVDEQGEFIGFDMDLIREVARRMDVDVKIVSMEFDSLIASLKQGKVDAVIACMGPSPDRLEEADFTDEYYSIMNTFLIKPDGEVKIETIDDAYKYTIGVQTGSIMDEWATKLVDEGKVKDSQIQRYTDANVAALDVKNGRLDAFAIDLPVAYEKARDLGIKVTIEYKFSDDGGPGILLKKGSTEMLDKLNPIIQEMKDDGFMQQLEEKWIKG